MNVMNKIIIDGREVDVESRNLIDRFGNKRVGSYMATSDGHKYWPFDPRPEEIRIEVIAHHLATACRWAGAVRHKRFKTKIFYAVAEHSVYVANYVRDVLQRPDLELEALLHDASEAYIGDLIRPLKYSPEFRKPFLDVEEINELALAKRFNLVYPFPKEIKIGDEAVCNAEHEQIIFWNPSEEHKSGQLHDDRLIAPYEIQMLQPYQAKDLFLQAYYDAISRREQYRPLPAGFRI